MAYKAVVLMGRRNDGAIPMIEVMAGADPARMAARAKAFLNEHGGCDTVELWVDDRCFTAVTRNDSPLDLAERIRQSGELFDATWSAP